MAVVAFPTGLPLERTSVDEIDLGTHVDILDDGSVAVQELVPNEYVLLHAQFKNLYESEKDTLMTFLRANKSNYITWQPDDIFYVGVIKGKVRQTRAGHMFNVSFNYYATELIL